MFGFFWQLPPFGNWFSINIILMVFNSAGIWFCRYSIRFCRYLISQAFNSADFSMLQVFKAAGIWVWRPYFWRFSILQVFDFEGFHVCRCSILQVFNSAGIRFRRFSILQVFKSAGFQFCRYSILQVFAPEGINFAGIVSKGLMSAGVLSVSLFISIAMRSGLKFTRNIPITKTFFVVWIL